MSPNRSRGAAERLEVYALGAAPLPARLRAGDTSLTVVPVGPVAVIVGPRRRASASMEQALRHQHDIVLSLAGLVDPLLPARFGTQMTRDQLESRVRPSVSVIADALEHVRGRRQMTVRLVGPPVAKSKAVVPTTGTAYLSRRHEDFHVAPDEAAPILSAVKPFVLDQRIQRGRAAIRATLFHLVAQEEVERYRTAADRSFASLAPSWAATVSGPWPAFAFAPELIA